MTIVAPPAAAPASPSPDVESRVRALGRQIAAGQATAGRSRTRVLEDRAWSCCRAILRFARRSSASSTSRPRVPTGVTWPPTSLLSSARRSGQSRRWARAHEWRGESLRAASGGAARARLARLGVQLLSERPSRPPAARPPAARVDRRSEPSPASPCTAWPRASSSARPRRRGGEPCGGCGATARPRRVDLLGEATVTARRGRPLRAALRRGAAARSRDRGAAASAARARRRRAAPAREPLGQGHRAHAATRAEAPDSGIARRRAPAAPAPADRAKQRRRAPARRHGVDGLARADHRARDRAPQRARVPDGPSAGIVLQAYLRDADEQLDRLLRGDRASRSRSASSRAPTGSTRRSRRPSTAGTARSTRPSSSPTAASSA